MSGIEGSKRPEGPYSVGKRGRELQQMSREDYIAAAKANLAMVEDLLSKGSESKIEGLLERKRKLIARLNILENSNV